MPNDLTDYEIEVKLTVEFKKKKLDIQKIIDELSYEIEKLKKRDVINKFHEEFWHK